MLFNSFSFLLFFPIVSIAYYLIPERFRVPWLLLASSYFYMSFVPKYILVLLFLITLDFLLAQLLEKVAGSRRTACLTLSIVANIGILFFFKYAGFFAVNVAALAAALHWNYAPHLLGFLLPLGLSFHVFQSLGYVIDVYRGTYKAEKNFLNYALYVLFFPQLVAGPIERAGHLLPQFRGSHAWNNVLVTQGLERMAWGFFKKLVIADNLAQIVSHVYATMPHDGPLLLLTIILFSYELYCDFSGYSDIALGCAQVLGYELTENFDRPYAATSVTEFWRRWHISLSSWFRDYLFTPLAFTLTKRARRVGLYASLIVTFAIIGLWHGGAWTFVLFGTLHGLYIVIGQATKGFRERCSVLLGATRFPTVRRLWQQLSVFALVSISFVFFRAADIPQALAILSHLGDNWAKIVNLGYLRDLFSYGTLQVDRPTLLVIALSLVVLELVQYLQSNRQTLHFAGHMSRVNAITWRYALIASIICFGYFGAMPFIYFQF